MRKYNSIWRYTGNISGLYQLPPVGTVDDETTCKFCFESVFWNNTFAETVQLKKIFRQNDDLYIKILNEIRIGKLHRSSFNALKERIGVLPTDITTTPTILLPRRQDVDEINATRLGNIEEETIEYTVQKSDNITLSESETKTALEFSNDDKERETKYLMKNILCDETVKFKKGAQVMCVANLIRRVQMVFAMEAKNYRRFCQWISSCTF